MYLAHYGFHEEPFSITSDPKFLWLSPQHEEAYAHLLYAIEQRKGFAVLSGDIGTGKTTLINSVLNRLGDTVKSAVVYNSSLNTDELFQYLFRDFDIAAKPANRAEGVIALNDWLLEQARQDINTVIIIDEAQNLSLATLEDLRLLSNLETAKRKLLQILLVGQPELNDKLADPSLHQLQQRIAIRYHLKPFKADETRAYVQHRLSLAGGPAASGIFDGGALGVIQEISAGVPRVINQVCDTALLKGYGKSLKVLDKAFLQSVSNEEFAFRKQQPKVRPMEPTVAAPTTVAESRRSSRMPWLVGLNLGILGLLAWALFLRPGTGTEPAVANEKELATLQQELAAARNSVSDMQRQLEELANRPLGTTEANVVPDQENARPQAQEAVRTADVTEESEGTEGSRDAQGNTLVRIRQNDTLMKIVTREYGQADWDRIQQILTLNPRIKNPNLIRIGDLIRIPAP
ncbi:MAG: AAA family ATPase [Calditrichaeota bacterium]|nr:AAA family ATPase [Calditrichota bacterium]